MARQPLPPLATTRLVAAAFTLLLSFSAPPVGAQVGLLTGSTKPADAPAETTAKPAAPEPIPAGDIPLRADADERFAQDVVRQAKGRDPSAQLGAQLSDLTTGIAKLSKAFENDDLKQLSAIRLESLQNHWSFYQRELNQWRTELDNSTGGYTENAAELAKRRVVWETTRTAMSAGGVTPALVDRVDVIIEQFNRGREGVVAASGRATQAAPASQHRAGQHRCRQEGRRCSDHLLRSTSRHDRCSARLESR